MIVTTRCSMRIVRRSLGCNEGVDFERRTDLRKRHGGGPTQENDQARNGKISKARNVLPDEEKNSTA